MNIEAVKSLQWVDFYLYALTDPGALYRQIHRNDPKPFALSFTVPVFVVFIHIVAASLLRTETPFFYSRITYGWLLSVFISVFLLTVSVAVMDGFAQFLGYRGNIREMISLVNFSQLPGMLLLPLVYIFSVLHFAPPFFYVFFSMASMVWTAFVAVKGIAEMHDCGPGLALLIYLFPYLLTAVAFIFILILSVMYLVRYLSI